MKSFIEELYYGNIEPQGRSRKQSPAAQKEFDLNILFLSQFSVKFKKPMENQVDLFYNITCDFMSSHNIMILK